MIVIHNATHLPLSTLNSAYQAFEKGVRTRKVSSTEMNEESSRSHMVFTVIIETIQAETK